MELGRKLASGTGNESTAKKLIELQESERQRKKLEEINLKLRIQIDDQVPKRIGWAYFYGFDKLKFYIGNKAFNSFHSWLNIWKGVKVNIWLKTFWLEEFYVFL